MSIQSIRTSNKIIQNSVLYFLNNDFDWLFWLRIETGLEYLEKRLFLSESERSIVIQHPLFWSWWLNQWLIRDGQVLDNIRMTNGSSYYQPRLANGNLSKSVIDISTPNGFKEFYTSFHQVLRLDVMPASAVMESIKKTPVQKQLINQ